MAKGLTSGLYIVATPIGNLGDVSFRAVDILKAVDVILAEDTRMTARLLQHYGIETPVKPYHEHNADRVRSAILKALPDQSMALVTDAGTPLISDPGYKLVVEARDAGHLVTTAPGPSAVIAALSIAGLPSDRFFFAGFAPGKSAARRRVLEDYNAIPGTLIFYESPQRVVAFLDDIDVMMGARQLAICREITKRYEEVVRGTAQEVKAHFKSHPPRGEMVVLIGPKPDGAKEGLDLDTALKEALQNHSLKQAVAQVTAQTGLPRKTVYARALALRDQPNA